VEVRRLEEQDVEFESMRSGGPGGQHGDRRATAVRLRVNIEALPLTETEQEFVREHLPSKNRTKDDEILVQSGEHRSQKQNRKAALDTANTEIREAIEAGKQAREKRNYVERTRRNSGGGGTGEEDLHEKQKKARRSETTRDLLMEALEQAPEVVERYFEGTGDQE